MDESAKKKTLLLFPSPVFVVGCANGESVHAFGGSWLGQCSFDPPLVWIGVKAGTRPVELIDKGGIFTVSVLRPDQKKTATVFFKTPPALNGKFGEVPFTLSPLGAPVLADCAGWVECRVIERVAPGDHVLYFGEVVECEFCEETPVLTTVTSGWKYGG